MSWLQLRRRAVTLLVVLQLALRGATASGSEGERRLYYYYKSSNNITYLIMTAVTEVHLQIDCSHCPQLW